jgi:hypothetical protein
MGWDAGNCVTTNHAGMLDVGRKKTDVNYEWRNWFLIVRVEYTCGINNVGNRKQQKKIMMKPLRAQLRMVLNPFWLCADRLMNTNVSQFFFTLAQQGWYGNNHRFWFFGMNGGKKCEWNHWNLGIHREKEEMKSEKRLASHIVRHSCRLGAEPRICIRIMAGILEIESPLFSF